MRKTCNELGYSNFGTYTSKYLCNAKGVKKFCDFLFDPSTSDTFNKWITNFENNSIISLYFLPFSIFNSLNARSTQGGLTPAHIINILDTQIKVDDADAKLYYVSPDLVVDRFYGGSVSLANIDNNYLAYNPFTKYQLYIPIIGVMDLEPSDVIGRVIDLFYTIDFETMEITATINSRSPTCTESIGQNKDNYQIAKASSTFGVQIALNGEDRSEQLMSQLKAFGNIISDAGLASMSGGLTATKLVGDVTSLIRPARGIQTGVSGAGINAFYDDNPLLIIHKTNTVGDDYIENLKTVRGRPLNEIHMIGETENNKKVFTGFIQAFEPKFDIDNDIDSIGITESEMAELKAVMANGFYIND